MAIATFPFISPKAIAQNSRLTGTAIAASPFTSQKAIARKIKTYNNGDRRLIKPD